MQVALKASEKALAALAVELAKESGSRQKAVASLEVEMEKGVMCTHATSESVHAWSDGNGQDSQRALATALRDGRLFERLLQVATFTLSPRSYARVVVAPAREQACPSASDGPLMLIHALVNGS
eukprot:6194607-Pleurochrysis_carterae.AAC.4